MRPSAPVLRTCLALLGCLPAVALAQDWRWQIQADLGSTHVQSGRLQTTAGGTTGSATPEYPTFDELGLQQDTSWQLRLQRNFGQQYLAIATQQFNPSASKTLSQDLIIQGQTFPAGSDVSSHLRFDEQQLEYGYHFTANPKLTLTPLVAFDLWQFSLRMQSPSATGSMRRSYRTGTLQLGGQMDYQLDDKLAVGAKLITSLPIAEQPQITRITFFGAMRLWDAPTCKGALVVALEDESLQYNDHNRQTSANNGTNTMSNDILMRALTPSLGVRVAF